MMGFIAGALIGIAAASVSYRVRLAQAEARRQVWESIADLHVDTLNKVTPILKFYLHLYSTIERSQAIAEAFGAQAAFEFISAEIESYPEPDPMETDIPHEA